MTRSPARLRFALPILLLPLFTAIPAAAQTVSWTTQFGTKEQDFPSDAIADGVDGLIVVGMTDGSMGSVSNCHSDAVVTRYDGAGNRLWLWQLGTEETDVARAAATDGAGGVFVAGETDGALMGGSAGQNDAWLVRVDATGLPRWRVQFGSASDDEAWAAAADGAGGVFLAGRTGGDLGGPFVGGTQDCWASRHDRSGNRMWTRHFGSVGQEFINAAVPDGVGGVFLCGWSDEALGGPSAGGTDAWVQYLDGNGATLWATQLGSSQSDNVLAGASDGKGGLYIGGNTDGDFGTGSGGAWIARIDGNGATLWVRRYGDSSSQVIDLAPTRGGVFATGSTTGSFGGPSQGQEDAWVGRFDGVGQPQWLHKIGSSSGEQPRGVVPGRKGGLLVTGYTQGMLGAPPLGKLDFWIARVAAP